MAKNKLACYYNTSGGYGAGINPIILAAAIADYNNGLYPLFDDRILYGDQDTGTTGATLAPLVGESYADFKTRLNAFLTARYNEVWGADNWDGGLCFNVEDNGVQVIGSFERLKLTIENLPMRLATDNGTGKNGISPGLEDAVQLNFERAALATRVVGFIYYQMKLEPELNYEENIRKNAGTANKAQVR